MADRCRCIVPYCRHTTGRIPADHEWFCGDHWRLVSRETKAQWRKYRRLVKAGRERGHAMNNCRQREWEAWEECKRQAIERAAGITA